MDEGVVARLAQEVLDYLPAGRVGLYEFVWILRSDNPGLPESEFPVHARAALDSLLADGSVRLVWERWGDADYEQDATGTPITDAAWNDPGDAPYLAVVAADDGGEATEPPANDA